jgi:cell wall-associated NlpC family hydrolase
MKLTNKMTIGLGLLLLSGCVRNPGDTMNLKQHSGPVKVKSEQRSLSVLEEGRHIVPVREIQNAGYVSLTAIAEATGFHGAWLNAGEYGLGDNDPMWIFRIGESEVKVAGKKSLMPSPAIKEGNELFIPASALQKLLGGVTVFHASPEEIAFFPKPNQKESGLSGKSLASPQELPDQPKMTAAVEGETASNLLAFAKKYLGVKYEFGTGPYTQTKTFDCSSFTQYVFEQFHIDLPRVASSQAEKGKYVPRDELQAGDLLFFYVPGRFKSNEVVGHVGIYQGNGNMIHASPKPEDGVQITPIDKAYWKDTYLFAKRYS